MILSNRQPAQFDLLYSWTPKTLTPGSADSTIQYIDIARDLSRVNRRFYEQNRNYVVRAITYVIPITAVEGTVGGLAVSTAANTWVVQNAHVKGEALWHEMNKLVLKDNPSIRGRWSGFRVQLSGLMIGANTLDPLAGDSATPVLAGEWDYSTYVMPQHSVDGAGNPLAAVELNPVLIGADTASKRSLTKAYEESLSLIHISAPTRPY